MVKVGGDGSGALEVFAAVPLTPEIFLLNPGLNPKLVIEVGGDGPGANNVMCNRPSRARNISALV